MLDLRKLASTLINLHGCTKRHAANEAGLKPANVGSWLLGKEWFLARPNQLRLIKSLGMSFGLLDSNVVHQWVVKDNIEDVRYVLSVYPSENLNNAEMYEVEKSYDVAIKIHRSLDETQDVPKQPTWIMITRPLMATLPLKITGSEIGISYCHQIRRELLFQKIQESTQAIFAQTDQVEREAPTMKG